MTEIITPESIKAQHEVGVSNEHKFPTEIIDLPSKGLLYPEDHPLRSGKIELKYMTAKEEDILSTKSYIEKGIVLDKLLQSLIVTKFNYDDLLVGDRNAIMIAARIFGEGPEYTTVITRPNGKKSKISVDLQTIKHKEIDETLMTGKNLFTCQLPISKKTVGIELFTVGKFKDYEASVSAMDKIKSISKGSDATATTLYRYLIKSMSGVASDNLIEEINNLRVGDTKFIREFVGKVQPDIDLDLELEDPDSGETFRTKIQLDASLFYPDLAK